MATIILRVENGLLAKVYTDLPEETRVYVSHNILDRDEGPVLEIGQITALEEMPPEMTTALEETQTAEREVENRDQNRN